MEVATSGQEVCTWLFQLVTGHVWKGTTFGGLQESITSALACRKVHEEGNGFEPVFSLSLNVNMKVKMHDQFYGLNHFAGNQGW